MSPGLAGAGSVEIATARLRLARDNAQQPERLAPVDQRRWPRTDPARQRVLAVWRSRDFLVVHYLDRNGYERLTVNRARLAADGGWEGGITWDELQRVKAEAGMQDRWAVECYPPDADVVNEATMRHLWMLDGPPPFAWV